MLRVLSGDSSSSISLPARIVMADSEQEVLGFLTRDKMVKLEEVSDEFSGIQKSFLSGMGLVARLISIHKNSFSSSKGQTRFQSFCIFSDGMAEKCGGSPNMKQAWYGGSREEICSIISHGFAGRGPHSRVYLSPEKFSIDGTLHSIPDENGLRHVLLCNVILGNMEVVSHDSNQSYPSSVNFDSGVDNLSEPRRYIIWGAFMNSHILPTYILSFRMSTLISASVPFAQDDPILALPPWMRYHAIIYALPPSWLNDYREKKLSRDQLVHRVSQVVRENDSL